MVFLPSFSWLQYKVIHERKNWEPPEEFYIEFGRALPNFLPQVQVQIFDEISICLKTFLFQKIDNHFLNAWDEYSQSKFLHIVEKNHIPLKLKKLWDFLICFWKLEEIFTIKKGYFTGKMLFCHEWGIASLPRFPHFFMFGMMQNQWRVSPQSLP